MPLAKALEKESLLAFAMNGEPIPMLHGAPLRMVAAGWPASASGKWVNELLVRDRVHDGEKMGGSSYRVPCAPVAPGAKVADDDMCIIESMPVKSLITFPRSGVSVERGQPIALRGHAWAGDRAVKRMHVSTDFGATWQRNSHVPLTGSRGSTSMPSCGSTSPVTTKSGRARRMTPACRSRCWCPAGIQRAI